MKAALLIILATLYGAPAPAGDWRLEMSACRAAKCKKVLAYTGNKHNCELWRDEIIAAAKELVKGKEVVSATCYGQGAVRA